MTSRELSAVASYDIHDIHGSMKANLIKNRHFNATTPPELKPGMLDMNSAQSFFDRSQQHSPPSSCPDGSSLADLTPHQLAGLNFTLANNPNAGANLNAQSQTHEMTIPNDLIGCIIGRGGCKINEIRQLSRATIKIANCEEGSSDRKVTIQGTSDTVNAAQYLINARISSEVCGLGIR